MKMTTFKRTFSLLFALALVLTCLPVVSQAEENNALPPPSRVIVSLGDSYSAGEGNPDYYDSDLSLYDKVDSQDWLAHRSKNSWPGQLTLNINGSDVTMKDSRDTYWYFAASSGAETQHMKEPQPKNFDKDGYSSRYASVDAQLDVFNRVRNDGREAEYVTVTIGGNDAGFADVVYEGFRSSFGCPSLISDKINSIWEEFYADGGIRSDICQSYYDIQSAAGPQAKIIVAGYPQLIKPGMTLYFSEFASKSINDSVTRFNQEISAIVDTCRADGMKICFVSVEEEFKGHEAYSSDPYIHPIIMGKLPGTVGVSKDLLKKIREEELVDGQMISAASMHPNEKGMEAYRKCVQDKIDQLERGEGEAQEWQTSASKINELDVVLVLDISGSMAGQPMEETKAAATSFVDTVLTEDCSVGVVSYSDFATMVSPLSKNGEQLKNSIRNLEIYNMTNIDAGLTMAESMLETSNAKKKIIVLMSDGDPNEGRTGDELIAYADSIKAKGISLYTLGFFQNTDAGATQALMESLASEGCHFEVDDADNLVYFFGDIADTVQGTRYIYVRIACPVDVYVEYNGEILTSKDMESSQRTSFGTLTFEENTTHNASSTDNRIKVLRLREGTEYDIRIEGNGTGNMNYSIGFMNDEGNYEDMREFEDVAITPDTVVDTVAELSSTTLNIDKDGDGSYDETLTRSGESYGSGGGGGGAVGPDVGVIIMWVAIGVVGAGLIALVIILIIKKKKGKKAPESASTAPVEVPQATPVEIPQAVPVAPEYVLPVIPVPVDNPTDDPGNPQ